MEMPVIIWRFILTFLLASLFGIERQRSHKPIGFGTYIFVAVGSCSLAIVAETLNYENPLPLLGAIVTGIGFLGAGALVRTSDKIFGFTTAASIWVFAIFGVVIGTGQYFVGAVLYALIWAVVFYDKYLEVHGIGSYQRKLILTTSKIVNEKEIKKELLLAGVHTHKMISIEIDKKNNRYVITYLIEISRENANKLPQKIFDKDWFESCRIE